MTLAPRLRAYIRRTILASAREYAYPKKRRTAESTMSACRDALHGTNTGWWTDLIYTADVLAVFNRHRLEIAAVIRHHVSDCGCEWSQPVRRNDPTTFAELLASTSRRHTFTDYRRDDERGKSAEAATLAVHLAIEYLAYDVAQDLTDGRL